MADREYQFDSVRFGASSGGLQLAAQVDQVAPGKYARLTNAIRAREGGLTTRPGVTSFATAAGVHHSVRRLNNPQAGTFTRVWGVSGNVHLGQSGALPGAASAGYSGDPLSLIPAKPPLSGASWMFIGDRSKMAKVNPAGLVLPIGLPAPGAAPTTAMASPRTTAIDQCDAGFAAGVTTGGAPVITYVAGKVGNAINIAMAAGAATGGYYSSVDHGFAAIDCTLVTGGIVATDDDFIHLFIKVDRPDRLVDLKVYFVASAFTAGTIPGTSTTLNTDAYMHAFRTPDFQVVIEQTAGAVTGGRRKIGLDDIDTALGDQGADPRTGAGINTRRAAREARRLVTDELVMGRGAWTEFGATATPLRRGDFARIGSDESVGWNTIRGVVFVIQTSTNAALVVNVDDIYLHGGYGLDSAEPGSSPYDFRFTNYDPRTGAESNGSPTQVAANFLDVARRGIDVTPAAYGDANIRQRIYRRGGSLNDNWYFEAVNAGDGTVFTSNATDLALIAAPVLPIDHYQPVPSVDSAGATILAQPVPYLWGPVDGVIYAAGDPNRPGHVYYCLPDAPDHWSATGQVEVCAPSEVLMNGLVYGSQSYCFSRARLYALTPNLAGTGTVVSQPTGCAKGLAGPWWFTVGEGGIYFGATDGVYVTSGNDPACLTNDYIRPLFEGTAVNGYLAIDFTVPTALRMTIYNHELWVLYQDTGGARQALIMNLFDREWRFYTFGVSLAHVTAEETGTGAGLLLMGGATGNASYQHSGLTDAGAAIPVTIRTGARAQGEARTDKIYGDLLMDLDRNGTTVTAQVLINDENTALGAQTISTGAGRQQVVLDPFGTTPQAANDVSLHVSWSDATAAPTVYQTGVGFLLDATRTIGRISAWDDLGSANQKYLTGITLDVDAEGAKTILVEGTTGAGAVTLLATLALAATGSRRQVSFSWTPVRVDLVRLRPTDSVGWKVYEAAWQFEPEPATWGNWNQNYTVGGTLTDKYIKGVLLDVDTLGLTKTIGVEIDGVTVESFTITTTGRQVLHQSLSTQYKGRVLRLIPVNPGGSHCYQLQWIFDQEPLALLRWEAQETDHGIPGQQILTEAFISLRAYAPVTLTITAYAEGGSILDTTAYDVPYVSGRKVKVHVPFAPTRAVLYKYLFTSSVAFALYREESFVKVRPWGVSQTREIHPFGNDDLDASRGIGDATRQAIASPVGMSTSLGGRTA